MKLINWKTTVAGIIAGLIPIAQTLAATLQTGAAINWTQIALGVFIMVLGVVAKDFNTTAIALVIALPLLQGCGATIKTVAATDADGQAYPFCVKVTQPLNPLAVRVVVLGCATTEAEAQALQAQYAKQFPAPARLAIVRGREAK